MVAVVRSLVAPVSVAAALLAGCGGGGAALDPELREAAEALVAEGGLTEDHAECLAEKVSKSLGTEQAALVIKSDANLSEQQGREGVAVASAYDECTGRSFSETFGYQPGN